MVKAISAVRRPFVEVQWDDASSSSAWATKDELPRIAKATNRGWVIAEDKTSVTLAASIIAAAGADEEEQFGDVTVIPRGCITAKRALR